MKPRRRATGAEELAELRRLAARYGVPLDFVDRLTLRPSEVARALGVGLRTVELWMAEGTLGARRVGAAVLIPLQAVLDMLESHPYARRPKTLQRAEKPLSVDDRAREIIAGGRRNRSMLGPRAREA